MMDLLTEKKKNSMLAKLELLYGVEQASACMQQIVTRLERFERNKNAYNKAAPDEQDVVIICYGDHISDRDGTAPLATLRHFLQQHYSSIANTVHILPFFPYSSDDGFSVVDYRAINPELGSWADVQEFGESFYLMFDAVINHISASSEWFKGYLSGDKRFKDYFIEVAPNEDVSAVTRPRTLPLLTGYRQGDSDKLIWTTFSSDQIDLNYANPQVLLEVIDILLTYVSKGASLLRLDAIGYLWKRIGTNCIHLPETHAVIQLIRDVMDIASPHCRLVTETNVPHHENISYFGDGIHEAQMVYQFALPPLVMHAFLRGEGRYLIDWAQNLTFPEGQATYFNFLASHDGIGVTPANGLLPPGEIDALCALAKERGGHVSYKNNPDGSQTAYELNVTYFNAIAAPDQPEDIQVQMFLTSQAIMLAMRGIPGVYINSLLGIANDHDGVAKSGQFRSINRRKFFLDELEKNILQQDSIHQKIMTGMRHLLSVRIQHKAFHPQATQQTLALSPNVFGLRRAVPDGSEQVICLFNLSANEVLLEIPAEIMQAGRMTELLTGSTIQHTQGTVPYRLAPFQTVWISSSVAD